MKSKIAQNLSYRFVTPNVIHPSKSNVKISSEVVLYRFSSNPRSKTGFWTRIDAIYRVRESKSSLPDVYQTFFAIFFGPWREYMVERSLKPKRFNVFLVLKWFSLLLEVTCVISARTTNTDGWLINLPRFQGPRPDHVRVESKSMSLFPRLTPKRIRAPDWLIA